jgi:hypothetical protein
MSRKVNASYSADQVKAAFKVSAACIVCLWNHASTVCAWGVSAAVCVRVHPARGVRRGGVDVA